MVLRGRVVSSLRKHAPAGAIVFLDPPYEQDSEYTDSLEWLGEHPPALVIVQHHPKRVLKKVYGMLELSRVLKQGENALTFYEPRSSTPPMESAAPDFTPETRV